MATHVGEGAHIDDRISAPYNVASPRDRSYLFTHLVAQDLWSPLGRPRRRRFIIIGFIAFALSLLLFLKELANSASSIDRWGFMEPPSFAAESNISSTSASQVSTSVVTAPTATGAAIAPVVFVLIIWSEPSAAEGALLIKSILLYNTSPSDIHIICDDAAQRFLETRLSLVKRPSKNVRVVFYKPSWQSMLDRVEREGSIKTDHSAGLPGLMKLFIHEILPPSVKRGIYIDTDALFISDPTLLWAVFKSLKPTTAIVMSSHPDQDTPEWNHASRICSCIMLLDLEKMRAMRMMDSSIYRDDESGPPAMSPAAFRAKYGEPGVDGHGRYENVRLGDQGYWWAIVDYRPEMFEPLSYDFEITSCLLDTYMTGLGDDTVSEPAELARQIHTKHTPQEGIVVLPKLLHFNCLHGTPVYMQWDGWAEPTNSLTVRWGPAVAYHHGYKWIWLNARDTRAALQMSTVSHVLFADEVFAQAQRHSMV